MGVDYLLSLFVILAAMFSCGETRQAQFQSGKEHININLPNRFYCRSIFFPEVFRGSGDVHVIVSLSYGEKFSKPHSSAVAWTERITYSKFDVCVEESGEGTNGSSVVNWIAYQTSPTNTVTGRAKVNLFTSGTKCQRVNFPSSFVGVPKVLSTITHSVARRPQDAMVIWLENLDANYFRFCLREVRLFDGKHENIKVDWIAFNNKGSNFSYSDRIVFSDLGMPLEVNNFAFCKVVNFSSPFYLPPVVIVTATHEYDSSDPYSIKAEDNAINAWVEEITNTTFRVCAKDLPGLEATRDEIQVDYIVIGDFDPCIEKSCGAYYDSCKAFGPRDARCVCVDSCPTYEEPVCSSNGTTYENECTFQREMCHLTGNFTNYHPGSCNGFPTQKGRHQLRKQHSWSEVVCDPIQFKPYVFYPEKPIHVQITVNHLNSSNKNQVHDATVSWIEGVTQSNFTVCVTMSGRNRFPNSLEFATVDWLAYQGAPLRGVAGEVEFKVWWTGTACETISFPQGKFRSPPTVLVTADHDRRNVKRDAASLWMEDVTRTSFKVCLRELQSFDGAHERITVNWMAFDALHRPLFSEHGSIDFPNTGKPQKVYNYAFCKDIGFEIPYNKTPVVLIDANHRTSQSGNLNPEYNAMTAWVEYINKTGYRVCVKELFVNKHDPLSVSYAVLQDVCEDGWNFFNGSCFYTSSQCDTWTNADHICRAMNSALVTVESQEENVFVQQRHNGARAWIGLNDIASEGNFAWVDGSLNDFKYWQKNQPNDLSSDQDCVHTLGLGLSYRWNDISCNSCHQYTCKKGLTSKTSLKYDDCSSNPCFNGGRCVDQRNGFTCICPSGFDGFRQCQVGRDCSDIYKNGERRSGVYTIKPDSQGTFQVYCDMTTDGGGWTVFQRRRDGSVDFFRNWQPYKTGFGNPNGEFWLGNDYIHRLTARTPSTLRIELEDWAGIRKYAKYGSLSVNAESDNYRLSVGSYSGTAGDSLSYHNNRPFTTKDRDNDANSGNCASSYTGAWWYGSCYESNLNGKYLGNTNSHNGNNWYYLHNNYLALKYTEMKMRPQTF